MKSHNRIRRGKEKAQQRKGLESGDGGS
ncbi:hypothetical protein N7450_007787 [Penicillium hetheringtonii]|uniref:Uncharacterized protein n=2 Tax=Penicillium TaxID=5073 RepID=A0A9W9TLZ7_PENCI|nr:hypothetical protein N7469_005973 [Penicillium citrinum]KAJ5578920.1 hypothetical protein N7450_007787 [Penicillium hetheringtonii]